MSRADAVVNELLSLTTSCLTQAEYDEARIDCLQRAIGFDTLYVGAVVSETSARPPSVAGVDARTVAHCEGQAERYWKDRRALNHAALKAGGAVCDQSAFSAKERDAMPLYREVMLSLGIRAVAVSVLQLQGQMSGCMYLGRTSRGARFGAELVALRRALPVLALGHRLYEREAGVTPRTRFLVQLTDREKEVLWHLSRGGTNALIAESLGTSPSTVKNQVSALLAKAGVRNRTELVHLATQGQDEQTRPSRR